MYAAVSKALARVTAAQEREQEIAGRLKALLADPKTPARVREAVQHAADALARFQGRRGGEDSLAAVAAVLSPLATDLEAVDRAPTGPQREVFDLYGKRLDSALAHWQALVDGDLRDLDAKLRAAGLAPVAR